MKNISNIDSQINEKKKRTAIIVCFLVLMICITGSTYAYFALTASNSTSVTGSIGATNSLTLTVNRISPNSTNKMIPQLESTLDEAISEEYNCLDDNNGVVCHIYKITIKNINSPSVLNGTITFKNINTIPNLKWKLLDYDENISRPIIGNHISKPASTTAQKFISKDKFETNEEKTYYIVVWVNETGSIQTDTGTYSATINFETEFGGVTSDVVPIINQNGSTYIQNLYNQAGSEYTTVNLGGSESNPTVTLNTTKNIMLDNNGEYRYYGANPDNYVLFNNELWRIISVSNVKSSTSDTTGSNRIKLIKNSSIGAYSWDSSESTLNSGKGVNNWVNADLNTLLNDTYYNLNSGFCYNEINNVSTFCDFSLTGLSNEFKSLTSDALWYLGQLPSDKSFTTYYANNFYTSERSSFALSGYPTNWTGKIGLIYTSDMAYATDLTICKNVTYEYRLNSNCYNNNWLSNIGRADSTTAKIIRTISTRANSGYSTVIISNNKYPDTHNSGLPYDIHPALYLNSDVIISTGNGTLAAPYTLTTSS